MPLDVILDTYDKIYNDEEGEDKGTCVVCLEIFLESTINILYTCYLRDKLHDDECVREER